MGGIPATQPPLTTLLERRDIPLQFATEHDTGVNCWPVGYAYTVFCHGNISEQGIILETKNLGGGDGGYTPVNDPIMLLFIGENTRG